MNSIRNSVVIEIKYLLKYKEFLYNYKLNQNKLPKTNKVCFCTICGDDCICINNHYNVQRCKTKCN